MSSPPRPPLQAPRKVTLQLLLWVFHFFTAKGFCSARQCPPCGNQTVPFPLSTAINCGHPHYRLSCTPSRNLQLRTPSGSYPVRDITPASQLLTVVPAPLLPDGSSCISKDLVHGGLVLNQSQPFTITPANSLFLFNCTQMMLGSPLNCTATSPCHEAILTAGAHSPCRPLLCCTLRNVTTMQLFGYSLNELACSAYTSVVGLDGSLPGQRWTYGVQLRWATPKELPCADQNECPLHAVCRKSGNAEAGFCRCISRYHWDPLDGLCTEGFVLRHQTALIAGLIPSLLIFSAMSLSLFTSLYRKRQAKRLAKAMVLRERSLFLTSNGGRAALFTAREMKAATDRYNEGRLLGKGGFGEVYKGVLRDGSTVAIKVARLGNVKGCDQVLNEVRILSQVNHRNVVRLLGCCIEAEQPLLVYEYVPNGTLLEHLSLSSSTKQGRLAWDRRLRIAKETAEGLSYLHSLAYPPIIHRDVKSSNILLDASLTAKVSDFGLSRLVKDDATHISTCAQGTLGYLDPHYYRSYQLSDKSDVYSFGVVLFELVSSQQVIDFKRDADDVNLAAYVYSRYAEGCLEEIFDPILLQSASQSEVVSMTDVVLLGIACTDEDGGKRPRMVEVAHRIDGTLRKLESNRQRKITSAGSDSLRH